MNNLVEMVDRQNTIIHIQSGIINDLFLLLAQHISAEELDKLPVIGKINLVANLRADIWEVTGQ